MAGITNRDPNLEKENQQRVEARKDQLPDVQKVNRPQKDHMMDKDHKTEASDRAPTSNTDARRGTEHEGR